MTVVRPVIDNNYRSVANVLSTNWTPSDLLRCGVRKNKNVQKQKKNIMVFIFRVLFVIENYEIFFNAMRLWLKRASFLEI